VTGAPAHGAALRPLGPDDWPAVAAIYGEGIESGLATFETAVPSWAAWDEAHLGSPRLVAELDGRVAGWAALSPVSRREAYRGVVEVSVYVAGWARRRGVGRALLGALVEATEGAGLWTLQATIFATNVASTALHEAAGFRLVGRRERIARRDGIWHDTLLFERRRPAGGGV
jgi:L-amino acid N-acyltransferase YncA